MKKFCIVALIVVLIGSLSLNVMGGYQRFKFNYFGHGITMIKDNKTGVCYLANTWRGGFTVMYDANGKI